MHREEQIQEISKIVCGACEMALGGDGDDCAEGSDYRKCGVCREVAEKLYDKYLYRKAFAYNDESPEQTAFKRGYAQGYCDGKEVINKELHRILQETLKGLEQ